MRSATFRRIYSNSKIKIGITLIFCITALGCLGYTERKTVIEKSALGDPSPILEFQSAIPEVKGNSLILTFQQKEITKFSTKVNVTTEIERNSKNEYCSHRKSSSEDYDPDEKVKCKYGKYKSNLVEAGVLSFGLMLPVILIFDWIAYPFIAGSSEKVEETSEAKFNPSCIAGSPVEKGKDAYLEYIFSGSWDNARKVPIKNCIAQIPLTSAFNKASSIDYRILINDKARFTGSLSYNSDGDLFKGDSVVFKAIRKSADRILEREENQRQIAQEQEQKKEVKACEQFLSNLAHYLDLKNPGTNRNSTCLFTCRNYSITTKAWNSFNSCQNRCNQCWLTLRWEDSWGAESPSDQMRNILNYESLTRPNAY
ncbi:hypothetical protein [Leptospira interrogans]|uniref:hypothetical protein n=1 Tax=Leptospira interrogans TaxID=173 RepID=UPI0002BB643D|nr:hypothetical protein [Leptospira interrogans]MCR8649130.1 hypothetical protein [Leptospira interrogans serovar Bataviae]OAM86099.1 hypothetical protein A1343_15815 [Leptospira interrogans serovar Bataviae]QOI40457.1 hypothetical protein Lepto1548_19615 [Leptospira interrogans serovar Bataviae]